MNSQFRPVVYAFHFTQPAFLRNSRDCTIIWDVQDAERVEIHFESSRKKVDLRGRLVFPKAVDVCELVLFDKEHNEVQRVRTECELLSPVLIRHLQLTPGTVPDGQPAKLVWDIEGATRIVLMPDNIPLPSTGEKLLYPGRSREYSIIAGNALQSLTKPLFVHVQPWPVIGPLVLPPMPPLHDLTDRLAALLERDPAYLCTDTGIAPGDQILNLDTDFFNDFY